MMNPAASGCCKPDPMSCAPKSCSGGSCKPDPAAMNMNAALVRDIKAEETRHMVAHYYGSVLKTSADLRTNCCTTSDSVVPKEVREIISKIPNEVCSKFYGCGCPIPAGIHGLKVLDLGCGSGRDCYVCAALVGPTGFVTGVDMTDAQLAVAQAYCAQWSAMLGLSSVNMRFIKGTIERLDEAGIPETSMDLVISNCVINLSPDKAQVLREAYRVLAPGGEMHFSDVYCDRRLPQELRMDPVLVGECLGGALYINDFYAICRRVGFLNPRILTKRPIEVQNPELRELLGEARFCSVTFRLFKLPGLLEDASEDYGQVVIYKGTIPGHLTVYDLDLEHRFFAGKPALVDGNTAAMLADSWLRHYFQVQGDRSVHYGMFPTGPTPTISTPTLKNCC